MGILCTNYYDNFNGQQNETHLSLMNSIASSRSLTDTMWEEGAEESPVSS